MADWAERLLEWFAQYQRRMPWRDDPRPYYVWLSEVMLQQTRVATVEERYRRWMERFPTVDSLASADVDDVLHEWQGLGY